MPIIAISTKDFIRHVATFLTIKNPVIIISKANMYIVKVSIIIVCCLHQVVGMVFLYCYH